MPSKVINTTGENLMNPKQKKAPKRPIQKGEPRFVYVSSCCGGQATKTPCVCVGLKSKEAETQGLGKWRCPTCRKVCKVARSKKALTPAVETAKVESQVGETL